MRSLKLGASLTGLTLSALASFACGSHPTSPLGPTPPVTPTSITSTVAVKVFNSDTPIGGVTVTSTADATLTATTDGTGIATFSRNIPTTMRFTFVRDGFLGPREQYFPGNGGTASLYPVDASHPENVTLGIMYNGATTSVALTQNACVVRGVDLQSPRVSLANWQKAADLVNALPLMAEQGIALRAVDAPDGTCAVMFTTRLDPSINAGAFSIAVGDNGRITGGSTAYHDLAYANDVRVLAHEFGRLIGLGTNPGSGLMSITDDLNYTDFTPLEKDLSLFKVKRGPGNKTKDVAPM